jgi:DNA modification methylase
MFPAQLVKRLIETFTRHDQRIILDPFVGIGSTVMAAEAMGKTGIGFDISPEFIGKARARPQQTSDLFANSTVSEPGERVLYLDDSNNLLNYLERDSVDLVVTSPPYWDILLQQRTADYKAVRHYGDSDIDLGRIPKYEGFLDALCKVFACVFEALKPGSYCCVIVMDIRKGPNFYPLHSDLSSRMMALGFALDDIIIWNRGHEYNNLRPLGHPSVFRINKIHEYILIFQKSNANRA